MTTEVNSILTLSSHSIHVHLCIDCNSDLNAFNSVICEFNFHSVEKSNFYSHVHSVEKYFKMGSKLLVLVNLIWRKMLIFQYSWLWFSPPQDCGNFTISLPLWFYVKSISGGVLEVQKVSFYTVLELLNFTFGRFHSSKIANQTPSI